MSRVTVILLVIITFAAPSAWAFEVRVRAEARLDVGVSAAGTVAQIAGTLRDDLGRGLPQRHLKVQIDARQTGQTLVSHDVHTDAKGNFQLQDELPPGQYEVFVRFDKTEHLDGIAVSDSLRLEPHSVDVRVFGPAFVYGREHAAWVSARAAAGRVPYMGWADVLVGGRLVGRMELDLTGRGTFDVVGELEEGNNIVTVRTPGSAYREEAEASTSIRFAETVVVEAAIEERLERLARGLAVYGTVRDSSGPIPGVRVQTTFEPVMLFDEPAALDANDESPQSFTVTTVTDDRGRYVGFLPSHRVRDGKWSGYAEFVPPIGASVKADAGAIDIDSRAYRWAVNGFGMTAIFAGILVLLGRLGLIFWERVRAWRAARERQRREQQALEEVETIVPVFMDPGTSPEPVILSRNDIGGVVWDSWRGEPIAGAELELTGEGGAHTTTADSFGRFRFADVPAGAWRLAVTKFGFMRGTMDLAVPHDGRLSHFRVDTIAVPLKIRRLYGSVLEHEVGEDLFGTWSPREIEERIDRAFSDASPEDRLALRGLVRERLRADDDEPVSGARAVAALTEVVEESYFSGRTYGEEAFRFARALALEMRTRTSAEAR